MKTCSVSSESAAKKIAKEKAIQHVLNAVNETTLSGDLDDLLKICNHDIYK